MNLMKGSLAETGLSDFTWKKLVSAPENVGEDGEKLPPVRALINTVNMLVPASLHNKCFHTCLPHDLYTFCTMCSMQPINKALEYISGKQVQLMTRDRLSVEEWRLKLKTYVRRIHQIPLVVLQQPYRVAYLAKNRKFLEVVLVCLCTPLIDTSSSLSS
jgi:hypothetical protein